MLSFDCFAVRPAALLLLTALCSASVASAQETLIDRVVAVVDGYPIMYSHVQEKVTRGPLVSVSNYPADEKAPPFEQALQDAINFELVMAKAKELEIDVRDDEVEAEIKNFLENRGVTREVLESSLAREGSTYEDYKEDFKDQMVFARFQGRVISPLVKVTDKDVETFYLKKSGSQQDLVELRLRQILVSVSATALPEIVEAKGKLAQEVHGKLVNGMDFQDAVKVYSDDENARETGGLMAAVAAKDLAPAIRGEVEELEVGKFTPPIRTALGFHIFYLEEKQFAGSQEFANQRRQLEFELRNVELGNQTRRWLTEQRQRSKVELIAE